MAVSSLCLTFVCVCVCNMAGHLRSHTRSQATPCRGGCHGSTLFHRGECRVGGLRQEWRVRTPAPPRVRACVCFAFVGQRLRPLRYCGRYQATGEDGSLSPLSVHESEALRAGLCDGLMRGPQLGGVVQGVEVQVDEATCLVSSTTTPVAVRAAAASAVQKAMQAAGPIVLEPLMRAVVRTA